MTALSRDAADDVTWVHAAFSTFLHSQLKLLIILRLNGAVYDTISPKEFIYFFYLNLIDNFNISKLNVKFEHQFTGPF